MLKFPVRFSDSRKVDKIIRKYYNRRLNAAINYFVVEAFNHCNKEKYGKACFLEYIEEFFPKNYPKEKMLEKFVKLNMIFGWDEKVELDLVSEYVLDRVIKKYVEIKKDTDLYRRKIPHRKYIRKTLKREDIGPLFKVEEYIQSLETLEDYESICFSNLNFTLLDKYSVEELMQPKLNRELYLGKKQID